MPTGVPRNRVESKTIDLQGESLEDVMPEQVVSEPEEVETWVIEDGEYVKKMVPRSSLSAIVTDADDESGELSSAWYEGRGREMEAKWLSIDTRYSYKQSSDGWAKVNPRHYKDQRYLVKNLPGLGEVITFQDCYLCEMPKAVAEEKRKERARIRRRNQLARMYSIGMGTMNADAIASKFGENASLINSLGKDDGFRPGIEAATLQSLPFDSPMAREARALVESITKHRGEAEAMNRIRQSQE